MAKTIVRGMNGLPFDMLSTPQWATITVGVSSGNPDVEVDATGVVALFNLPANIAILDAKTAILEAFTASVNLDIGDSDASGDLVPEAAACATVASSVMKHCSSAGYFDATGMKNGVFYASTGMVINATISGATPAVGKALVAIQYQIL